MKCLVLCDWCFTRIHSSRVALSLSAEGDGCELALCPPDSLLGMGVPQSGGPGNCQCTIPPFSVTGRSKLFLN
eukprot:478593-Amphidinium_carterae.1